MAHIVLQVNATTNEASYVEISEQEFLASQSTVDTTPPVEIEPLLRGYELPEGATYLERRAVSYPSLAEQLDMQYWDSVNGTTTWADAIAAVKAEYPKS